MERLRQPGKKGLGRQQLLLFGMLFLLAGMVSRSFLQNRVLQMGSITGWQLLEVMSTSSGAVAAATVALVMQALETCGIPIFAFLLVEEYETCKNRRKMLLFLLIMALVSEIPYNFVMWGKFLHLTSRSPAVAMVIGMAVLYFLHRYSENSFKHVLVRIFVGIAAVLWAVMLNVDHGVALLVVMMTMWALRKKKHLLALVGGAVAAACVLISPFYIVSAMGILPVYLCREEEPADTKIFPYLIYPVLLLVAGLLSYFI